MRGKYSKNNFFKKYPQIIQTYFQGSQSTTPKDVNELFNKVEDFYHNYKINSKNNDYLEPIYDFI